MRKFITAILTIILCVLLAACSSSKENVEAGTYTNEAYGVSLKYPSDWKTNNSYMPDRYEGSNGFFQVAAAGGGQGSIDEAVKLEAEHQLKPYGTAPTIEKLTIAGQEARLILPSEDQPAEMKGQAGLFIQYPNPLTIDKDIYRYFVLWADKDHIRSISESIEFIR